MVWSTWRSGWRPHLPTPPFDSRRSWLFGEFGASSPIALIACAVLVVAGVLVLAGAGAAAVIAAIGAAISLLLVLVTFHPWFLAAVAINVAIIVIAVT
jgi:hypothetical protein